VNRPTGVAILSVLAGIAGVLQMLAGIYILGFILFGPGLHGTNLSLAGWSSIILGFIWLSVSGALWSLRPWAWMFGMIVAVFGVIEGIWIMIAGDNTVASGVGSMIFPLIVLFYLNREPIKTAFGMTDA
jgi:hypothetical protein